MTTEARIALALNEVADRYYERLHGDGGSVG